MAFFFIFHLFELVFIIFIVNVRWFWIIAFGLSLWLCTIMVNNVWNQWLENPVDMSFTHKERPISDIPFPTVTICPEIRTMKHKLDLNPLFLGLLRLTAKDPSIVMR